MNDKKKTGCLLCWPVILINLLLCFPLGLILMIVRISKNVKAKQNANKTKIPYNKADYGYVDVPEDLFEKGKEIESNLEKELYCNKRDLPLEILRDIKWLLLGSLPIIALFIFLLYHSFQDSVVTGIVMIISFNIVMIPFYLYLNKRVKKVKKHNSEVAQWLREVYQETFNTFVFSEYIERRLLSVGVVHSENDRPNQDNPEYRKFYHFDTYYEHPLRYKYAGQVAGRVSGFSGFNFDNSIWKFGPFCYNVYDDGYKKARLLFLSRKPVQNEVVVFRKGSNGYHLEKGEKNDFKKYEMDNSRFNEKFDVYAKDSIELFKIFTPSYMEKVIEITEKHGVGFISIQGDVVAIDLDSKFPTLTNSYVGFNVQQAIAYAENAFQYFMTFMEDISPIGI